MHTHKSFPHPQRERWQPLRSGFVNLYRYDREEFHYDNGRLLLRGNNGTGKSRVLAMQLPFLLDGEVIPQRLEPDADPAKRIEWNLLMGKYPDRTGYTWIEFGRRDENGEEHYITLGCGLSATEGQSGVRKWFFISSQRIGVDLELTGEGKQVLAKDRLRERIGNAGEVFEAAPAYRRAVNEALFHLDDYRYASFVNLLIQLRRPQLTRRLDEDELSGALSEALAPVSTAIIAKVGDAFRGLESDRSKLESFKTAMHAVDRFLAVYRCYAKGAARRSVDRVRATHYEYEAGMKDILLSEEDCDRSLTELARLKAEIQRLSADQAATEAEIQALQQNPELQNLETVERMHREAKEKRTEAESAALELTEAVQRRRARAEEYVTTKNILQQRQERLAAVAETAAQSAAAAGLEHVHREYITPFESMSSPDEIALRDAQERIQISIQSHFGKVEHLRKLNERVASAKNEFQQASLRRDQLFGLLDDARERMKSAQYEHNTAVTSFLAAAWDWRAGLAELRLPFEESFLNTVAEWCENPQAANPFNVAVRAAVEEVIRNIAEQRVVDQLQQRKRSAELHQLQEERRQVASDDFVLGLHDSPSDPGSPGAPLWQLCDFADGVDAASRAGIEAALDAAGLLYSWVTPSGELVDPEKHDAVLVVTTGPLPAEDAHLGTLLVPSNSETQKDYQVPPYVVGDILRHIGARPNTGYCWISADGQWQNGLLHGYNWKHAAEYIGQSARDVARDRRRQDLDRAIADAQADLDSLLVSIEDLNRREAGTRREAESAPSDEDVRTAYLQAIACAREVDRLRNRLAEMEDQTAQKRSRFDDTTRNRDVAVADLGIAKWADDLDSLASAVSNYAVALSCFWPVVESVFDARATNQRAWAHMEEAGTRESRQKEIADRLERAATAAEIAHDMFRQAIGTSPNQTLQQLEEARRRVDDLRTQETEARRQHHDTELTLARVDERLRNLTDMLNGHTERRNTAASALRALACTGLLRLAVAGIADEDAAQWSTNRTVEAAFELASTLETETDSSGWEHYQKSMPTQFNELMQSLSGQGYQLSATFRDGIFVAGALFRGRDCTIEQLRQTLADEVTARQMLLDAREKEILENYLVGDVCNHLHDLLYAAEAQVQQMNAELDSRPTSTGMKLRFVWRAAEDGPSGLTEARARLLTNDSWSSAEREMLGNFFHQQIQTVCSQIDSGSWQESLTEALDYRKWHRFGVERYQDGVWKRLTRRTHGTGSGGEKALALTLPYFAAAAAFYRTADPLAPRLILLDEAFVGIDADMRAKCMGLIHTFDLDFIMTSEREWGCYQTLPGLAIYQLSTRSGIDAISLTRWAWNGQVRTLNSNVAEAEDVVGLLANEK